MCPPISSARSDAPAQREPLVAGLVDRLVARRSPRPCSRSHSRARSHVSVQATRCAPFSSPVSSRSSSSSRDGAGGIERHRARPYNCGRDCGKTSPVAPVAASVRDAASSRRRRCGTGLGLAARCVLVGRRCSSGLWEGYRWIWMRDRLDVAVRGQRHVDAAHPHDRPGALRAGAGRTGRALIVDPLSHEALFTAKEAVVGFALGAIVRLRARRRARAVAARCSAAFLPYIVASQTIPILAIAPMVVVWLNPKLPASLQGWGAVAVIAAYLTFFPVTINTLRGLQSADPRALELMRSYAAEPLARALEAARPGRRCRTSSPRSRSRRPRASSARSSASCRPVDPGRPRRRDPQLQPVLLDPARRSSGRRTSSRPRSGSFFLAVVLAEKLVVRRAPEHVA